VDAFVAKHRAENGYGLGELLLHKVLDDGLQS